MAKVVMIMADYGHDPTGMSSLMLPSTMTLSHQPGCNDVTIKADLGNNRNYCALQSFQGRRFRCQNRNRSWQVAQM